MNDWTVAETENAHRLAQDANGDKNYGNGKGTLPDWNAIADQAKNPENYISGEGVGSWERWREDIDIAKSLGLNALRYSIEWSRVEPTPGSYDPEAIQHYRDVTQYCIKNGITPFISLHHFTNPLWFSEKGAWEEKEAVTLFDQYSRTVVEALPQGEEIRYVTINEPNVYAGFGWMYREWPPYKRNYFDYRKVQSNLIEAHKHTYNTIKSIDDSAEVSSAVNYIDFEPKKGIYKPMNAFIAKIARRLINEWFHKATIDEHDFIGLNHYMHSVINMGQFKNSPDQERSDMGWYLNPANLKHVVKEASAFNKPIVITEHGFADATDRVRGDYLKHYLKELASAIHEGADVRGYLHWSLLDNFEWANGYWPKFGLVSVDRSTMERTVRKSAYVYKAIIESVVSEDEESL